MVVYMINFDMLDSPDMVVAKEKSTVKQLREYGIRKHQEFDRGWGKESFHNEHHIKTNIEASRNIIQAASKDDIFNLKEQLKECQDLTLAEFKEAVVIAFSLHDLGNIGKWKEEKRSFDPFPGYKFKGAEERSIEIAQGLMKEYGVNKRYRNLVSHLIDQTRFEWEEGEPDLFGRFVRSVDQLSTNLNPNVEQRKKSLISLVKESEVEDESAKINPNYVVNFAYVREDEILPQGVSLEQFAKLAGYDRVPDKITGVVDKKLQPEEAISEIRNAFY